MNNSNAQNKQIIFLCVLTFYSINKQTEVQSSSSSSSPPSSFKSLSSIMPSSSCSNSRKTAAFQVPILPHTSPEAEQPPGFVLPLYKHQLRALSRCQLLENETTTEGNLAGDFGQRWDYKSRGGCLADQVGTGKTATILGLILSQSMESNTLIVAPTHLIPQWTNEIAKFCKPGTVEVIVGKPEYLEKWKMPNPDNVHRIVLIDVETIINEDKLWYDFRKVFSGPNGHRININHNLMQTYREAANFCVRSPKGGCSYDGYVYTGQLHIPKQPWSRVIFDEIQDLVKEGTDSQKCLLQLTRTAKHVWLMSATPFPHGNRSVHANNELLGFQRLRMNVEVDTPLPSAHTFEKIKRKLYIRSPPHVADQAVSTTVTRTTEYVQPLDMEKRFYKLEEKNTHDLLSSAGIDSTLASGEFKFGYAYDALRQMTVHPEASSEFRKMMGINENFSRPVSASVRGAAQRAVKESKARLRELVVTTKMCNDLKGISRSLSLARNVKQFREEAPLQATVFTGPITDEKIQERKHKERKIIHDAFCTCSTINGPDCFADRKVHFRVLRAREDYDYAPEFLTKLDHVFEYFDQDLAEGKEVSRGVNGTMPAINSYITHTQRCYMGRQENITNLRKERQRLQERIETLSVRPGAVETKEDYLAKKHGSKPAALIRFLKARPEDEKVIVFSYWHDTLKLVHRTLQQNKLHTVFCDKGQSMASALEEFTTGNVDILLMSAQSKASGANLQVATHVILLDPAGSSAEHGSTLEEQAIGRAARMGQSRNVTVTRFCCTGTLEYELFNAIDMATTDRTTKANNLKYVIQDADRAAPKSSTITAAKREEEEAKMKKCSSGDVEVTASLTQEDRMKQSFQKAQENGNVIDLMDDSDDEDNKEKNKGASLIAQATTKLKCSKVKKEKPGKEATNETPNAKKLEPLKAPGTASPETPSTGIENNSDLINAVAKKGESKGVESNLTKNQAHGKEDEEDDWDDLLSLHRKRRLKCFDIDELIHVHEDVDMVKGQTEARSPNKRNLPDWSSGNNDTQDKDGINKVPSGSPPKRLRADGDGDGDGESRTTKPAANVGHPGTGKPTKGRPPKLVREDPRQIEKVCVYSGRVLDTFATFEEAANVATDAPQKWGFMDALEGFYGENKNSHVYKGYQWRFKDATDGIPQQPAAPQKTATPLTREVTMEVEEESPLPSSSSSLTRDDSELKQLLVRFDLADYQDKFLEAGYDSVSWLYEVANNESVIEQLAETVGFKPGHAIRFQTRLAKEANNNQEQEKVSPP